MEFITVAREIERLSFKLTYRRDEDLFYDTKGRLMHLDNKEQWNEETEMLKELNDEEQGWFLDLLAHLCPGA